MRLTIQPFIDTVEYLFSPMLKGIHSNNLKIIAMKELIKNEIMKYEQLVAFNIKRQRLALKLSQKDIASELGVSVQQIQKYESSTNRVSAGKLPKLMKLLKMPLISFFSASANYRQSQ